MGSKLALIRLRGWYAIVAAALLIVGLPLFQGAVLAPEGYVTAAQAIVSRQDFGPLLVWVVAHPAEARVFRALQLIPFLLAAAIPPALRLILWPRRSRASMVLTYLGMAGFLLFALALAVGLFTSGSAAARYALASAAQRPAVAEGYASSYALETLLSRVLGGLGLAIYLASVSLRVVRQRALPVWIAYLGGIVAALLAANAVLFALVLRQAQTPIAGLVFFGLGLWLAAAGYAMIRLRAAS